MIHDSLAIQQCEFDIFVEFLLPPFDTLIHNTYTKNDSDLFVCEWRSHATGLESQKPFTYFYEHDVRVAEKATRRQWLQPSRRKERITRIRIDIISFFFLLYK